MDHNRSIEQLHSAWNVRKPNKYTSSVIIATIVAVITPILAVTFSMQPSAEAIGKCWRNQSNHRVCPSPSVSQTTISPSPIPSTTSPTPSPTITTTSPSPTPSPTTSSPSPTTSSSSPSPTNSPSPSPSPTEPPPRINDCMPSPHLCGFPDETNTGVPSPLVLTERTGEIFLTTAGVSFTNIHLTGCIHAWAKNLNIKRIKITQTCGYAAIDGEDHDTTGTVIEDVEIDGHLLPKTINFTGQLNQRSITGDNLTINRVWWHDLSDCVHYGSNVIITNSFCNLLLKPSTYPGDPHLDGFQSAGGSDVRIEHNTIRNPNNQTSAIINGTDTSVSAPQYNVRIINNLMAGGGWTVYCNAHYATIVPTIEFSNNRIAKTYYTWPGIPPRGGYYGPTTDCETVPGFYTTMWDEDGSLIRTPLTYQGH